MTVDTDILVVGGGINGTGIARDAAGRGLSVCLCEQDDLAAHASSASTKLIHGGLRYLEQYEFRLVAKALAEREVILRLAPHIVWPLLFVLPHESHLRPVWMIRLGLLLYDHLGPDHRSLADSTAVDLAEHVSGKVLDPRYKRGFVYSDAWVQDSRLVVLNAADAAHRGADIRVRTRCERVRAENGRWIAELADSAGQREQVHAKSLVNATGPWAARFLDRSGIKDHPRLRLVKGSHIVLPQLFAHDYAYIFQQPDRRIVFAIPYERHFTLVGTTDVDFDGDPSSVAIDDDEIRYLCDAVNRYFREDVQPEEVVWSYSGVRPLVAEEGEDASSTTRDYRLQLGNVQGAPLLNVFGGKITTHRRLAEEAMDALCGALDLAAPAWTADGNPLPGGDFVDAERLLAGWTERWPWLPVVLAHRWLRHYGTCVESLLDGIDSLDGLGRDLGGGLYTAEVDYLVEHEWARTAEDVLWRRTKLGLHLDDAAKAALARYLASRGAA